MGGFGREERKKSVITILKTKKKQFKLFSYTLSFRTQKTEFVRIFILHFLSINCHGVIWVTSASSLVPLKRGNLGKHSSHKRTKLGKECIKKGSFFFPEHSKGERNHHRNAGTHKTPEKVKIWMNWTWGWQPL